jgi:magnesium chelatase family protein
MLARVFSCAVIGLEGVIVEVEVDLGQGLPGMTIVGLPDASVQESRERVQAAIKNAGMVFPRKRIIVNLAPASVRKEGPAYDLPIALGVLIMNGLLPAETVEEALVIGELSLDGSVRHTRGCCRWPQWRDSRVSNAYLYPNQTRRRPRWCLIWT